MLSAYRVFAVNTALSHENRIHSDEVAVRHGFRGGLVPGVNVYGYLTVPVVRHFGVDWLCHGWMRVRFLQPFYEGEEVVVQASVEMNGSLRLDAERASGEAGLHADPAPGAMFEAPLPVVRPLPSTDLIQPGLELGSYTVNLAEEQTRRPPALSLSDTLFNQHAHPAVLLGLSNEILVRNFVLAAWIHTSSDVRNYGPVRADQTVTVRGRIRDAFARKGHEFLIADVTVVSEAGEVLQHVIHSAIWRLREA